MFYINGKYEDILVDVTGTFADYVLFSTNNQLTLFRQYEIPILVFEDTFFDFSFNVTYTNAHNTDHNVLSNSTVKIANYPVSIFKKDPRLNDTKFLNSLINYTNDNNSYVINDHGWLGGAVINYTINC